MYSQPDTFRPIQGRGVYPQVSKDYERQVYRYVEAELYAHPLRKRDIERLRADIIEATPERSVTSSENPGDPTLLRAMRLLTSKRLERMMGNYEAIAKIYESLDDMKKRLVDMRYWQRKYTDCGIYENLHISRRTYFRWREEILAAMAIEMGLL